MKARRRNRRQSLSVSLCQKLMSYYTKLTMRKKKYQKYNYKSWLFREIKSTHHFFNAISSYETLLHNQETLHSWNHQHTHTMMWPRNQNQMVFKWISFLTKRKRLIFILRILAYSMRSQMLKGSSLSSTDLEVQLMQLYHCDGV